MKLPFEILSGSPASKGKADSGAIFTENFILLLGVLTKRFSLLTFFLIFNLLTNLLRVYSN